jgi:hypothetical protein
MRIAASWIGPGVPPHGFAGRVAATHARACLIALTNDRLVTLVTPEVGGLPHGITVDTPNGFSFERSLRVGARAAVRIPRRMRGVTARLPGPGRCRGRRLQQVGVGDVLHQLRDVALTGCFDWPLTASELRHVAGNEDAAHWLLRLRTSCSTCCRAASES